MARTLFLQLGFVLAINLLLWPLDTWKLPGPVASLAAVVIFLTATYNNVIPKTIYWTIVFTFGKRLFFKIRSEGIIQATSPIMRVVPEFKKAYQSLEERSYSLLLAGGGIGLAIANNFASYSRFSEARNKIDKYFVALVISFAVSYLLGESKKNWMFKFAQLGSSDLSRLLKRKITCSDDHTFMLLSGFVAGLLLDAPLILLKLKYGGYFLGGLLVATAFVLHVVMRKKTKR
ncbi:MAG: hypothetical protein QHH02_02840 [Syntrophomonadaceae bacterium]|nr:hypothetical protein [Syntrophomonadaceae bacterium]